MTDNRKDMSCEEFDAKMSEMIASGEDIFSHPHVQSCELHKALLADLEAIAKAARELFPEVEPSEDLWKEIETKLETVSKQETDGKLKTGGELETGNKPETEGKLEAEGKRGPQ